MPVIARSYDLHLVEMTTGVSPITGTDPYDPSVVIGSGSPSFPSNNWHWSADIPDISADWITVFSSVILRSVGPTLFTSFGGSGLLVACNFDDGPMSGQSVIPNEVVGSSPVTFQQFFWLLFDDNQIQWEEFWLTQAMIDVGPTARRGPGYGWLEPNWKAQMGNNTGNLTYYIAPFPHKFDFWFTAPSFWRPTVADTSGYPPFAEAIYTIEDQRVIIVACSTAEILMHIV